MKTKRNIAEIICLLLMLNFFYEGIYKIAYLGNYSFYITHAPLLRTISKLLAYFVPVGEIILSLLIMIPRFRKAVLYMVIGVQVTFVMWIMSVYFLTNYLFWPYHALWERPTWMQKMIFALALSWLAFTAIILSRNKVLIRRNTSKSLPNSSVDYAQ